MLLKQQMTVSASNIEAYWRSTQWMLSVTLGKFIFHLEVVLKNILKSKVKQEAIVQL